MHPVRLLVCSYGLSILAGGCVFVFGGGTWVALMTFWLGGGVVALTLPFTPGVRSYFRHPESDAELADADALGAWDEDRLRDAVAQDDRNRADREVRR